MGLALLVPTSAVADTGPSLALGDTATRAALNLVLPVQISCPPTSSFFGFFGPGASAQIHVLQANGNSAPALGVGVLGISFGPPPPGVQLQQIVCDASLHTYNVTIAPDLVTDPYTASFKGGQATATGNLVVFTTVIQCFPWGCFPVPQQQTLTAGPQVIHIKG